MNTETTENVEVTNLAMENELTVKLPSREELDGMNKKALIATMEQLVAEANRIIHNQFVTIEGLDNLVKLLNTQLESRNSGDSRREQVLDILKQGPAMLQDIADKLNTTTKNVSSQLSYLRKDGVPIGTDHLGRKFIVVIEPTKPAE